MSVVLLSNGPAFFRSASALCRRSKRLRASCTARGTSQGTLAAPIPAASPMHRHGGLRILRGSQPRGTLAF